MMTLSTQHMHLHLLLLLLLGACAVCAAGSEQGTFRSSLKVLKSRLAWRVGIADNCTTLSVWSTAAVDHRMLWRKSPVPAGQADWLIGSRVFSSSGSPPTLWAYALASGGGSAVSSAGNVSLD